MSVRIQILLFIASLFSCAASFRSYPNEWKVKGGRELFFAGISARASEKAINQDSASMKQQTCIEAAKIISTSAEVSQYLLDGENHKLSETEFLELGKRIAAYQITPQLVECQPGPVESIVGITDWASCQCLYSYQYPGGRRGFQKDITKIK